MYLVLDFLVVEQSALIAATIFIVLGIVLFIVTVRHRSCIRPVSGTGQPQFHLGWSVTQQQRSYRASTILLLAGLLVWLVMAGQYFRAYMDLSQPGVDVHSIDLNHNVLEYGRPDNTIVWTPFKYDGDHYEVVSDSWIIVATP